jgi:titin
VPGSSTEIDLDWADVADETGYRVERSPDGENGWIPVVTTGQDVTTYSDTLPLPGTTYHYRVFATNAGADSPPSDVTSATTLIDLASPTIVTAVAVSSTEIVLVWADVGTETGYRIERSPDGVNWWSILANTGQDVTTFSDTGLLPGTTYHYWVFATNAGGDSPPSDVVAATTGTDPAIPPVADEPTP